MKWIVGCGVLAALGGLGCRTGALPQDEAPLPDALTCAQTSWSVVRSLGTGSEVPSNLLLRDGTFYVSLASQGIVALPADGSDPVVLTSQFGSKLWLEGDAIYFEQGADRLLRVPLTGGTREVVVYGLTTGVDPDYAVTGNTALDTSYFYWDLSSRAGPETYSVWRAPRAGGVAEKLADLPPRDPAYAMPTLTLSPDTLIVSLQSQNVAYVVPLAGGSAQTVLPPAPASGTYNNVIGSSADAVMWMNERWNTGELYPTTHLSVSDLRDPGATAAHPFWTTKPPYMYPWAIASGPDGAGGWLIAGAETHADRKMHTSVWAVDADGANATRLGCNPDAGTGAIYSTVSTPEAVYAVVSADDPVRGYQWLLVRIDRVPAPPDGA